MKRGPRILKLSLLILGLLASLALAAEAPRVRMEKDPKLKSPLWVGQKITFSVILLSPTFFSGTPVFEIPTVPGGVLMKIPDRPVVGSETLDGQEFSSQRHDFALYAQKPGPIGVPAMGVRFGVAGHAGAPAVEHGLRTDALQFETRLPPGAEKLGALVSTTRLTVHETWNPVPQETGTVGDALERTVTFEASDIPGMVFPPLPSPGIPGVAIYPKPPQVSDKTQRGAFTGRRVDAVTYVMEKTGTVTLPAMVFYWYNMSTNKLEQVELPAVTIDVAAAPPSQADETGDNASVSSDRHNRRVWTGMALLLLLVAALMIKYGAVLRGWWKKRQKRRRGTEKALFQRLLKACRNNFPPQTDQALLAWLTRVLHSCETPSVSAVLKKHPDPDLTEELHCLQAALLEKSSGWNGKELARRLKMFRSTLQTDNRPSSQILPELNPL